MRSNGALDDKIYTMTEYEKVQRWLMNKDACLTTWSELIRIRNENSNYSAGSSSMSM